ncbi:Hypothetical predicted protein [Paramuricea clavata]|uniref:Uncharacterized protein n=1 Tax=Paramuricea clavata TaxID=317549 RepID=A0A6S7JTH3_PARCT|nr:Hypothetical predicted protein [Paramuricea clavata]
MAKNKKKREKQSKTWEIEQKEMLKELWQNYDCLFKTNSAEFKRVDKRQAALEDIRQKLETELESSFTDSITPVKTRPTSGDTCPASQIVAINEEVNSGHVHHDINDVNENEENEDNAGISRVFDSLIETQNDPNKSAKSKVKIREKMENIVFKKSLTVLYSLGNKRKSSEENDADRIFGIRVQANRRPTRQIEDRRSKELVKLKI